MCWLRPGALLALTTRCTSARCSPTSSSPCCGTCWCGRRLAVGWLGERLGRWGIGCAGGQPAPARHYTHPVRLYQPSSAHALPGSLQHGVDAIDLLPLCLEAVACARVCMARRRLARPRRGRPRRQRLPRAEAASRRRRRRPASRQAALGACSRSPLQHRPAFMSPARDSDPCAGADWGAHLAHRAHCA
jgi:hypothetical protein